MRKLAPVLLLALLIPQVAFAAWWNPFSWIQKVFNRLEPKIETLDTQEVELDETKEKEAFNDDEVFDSVKNDRARFEAEKKVLDTYNESIRISEEKLRQQKIETERLVEEAKQADLRRRVLESEVVREAEKKEAEALANKLQEESASKSVEMNRIILGDISCSRWFNDYSYFLPITVEGTWRSGWVQIKDLEGKLVGGKDFDNSSNGLSFSRAGVVTTPEGHRESVKKVNMEGLRVTYVIKIFDESASFIRPGIRYYPPAALILEKEGKLVVPSCN